MFTVKVNCHCKCSEVVTADLGAFTATIEACSTLRKEGIESYEVPRSKVNMYGMWIRNLTKGFFD